jgi:hypothetical protein
MRIRILIKVINSATTGLQILQGSILIIYASIGSVHGLPWLHFEPLKLLNFVFSADRIRIIIGSWIQIRIRVKSGTETLTATTFLDCF